MALISPGVQVTIIDESQYIPAATNSVPYILLATAQNKISGAGIGVAAGTLEVNANKVYLMSSQRDLLATYGNPFFYKTTTGTPINGYELNEYGLLAAYSALGVSNRCFIQRANIDLAALTATLIRPTGAPDNNTYWLDTANTAWGIFQWNQVGTGSFVNEVPLVITDVTQLQPSGIPLDSLGSIGNYAVVTTNTRNPIYYKRGGPTADETSSRDLGPLYNTWVEVGSDDWKTAWPTIQGILAPTALSVGSVIDINGAFITVRPFPDNTVEKLSDAINAAAIPGVYSSFIGGQLQIYGDSVATNDGSTGTGGIVSITNSVGVALTALGIVPGEYNVPQFLIDYSYNAPRWASGQPSPAPTGSVWLKANNVNLGANLVVKKFNSTLGVFVQQACPLYLNDGEANFALDPSGGGSNIPAGSTVGELPSEYSPDVTPAGEIIIYQRFATGPTIITGSVTSPTFVTNNTFVISATSNEDGAFSTPVTATILGTTASAFCAAVSAAAVPYVSASINSAGNIVFTHSQGGSIRLINQIGTPVTTAGFSTGVRGVRLNLVNNLPVGLILSNWVTAPTFTYSASDTAPDQDPADNTLWYYSATTQVDIMIQDDGVWQGYQNVVNDVRGDNLTLTNATGPIFSTNAPTTQTDESASPLVFGDLWIDTSDLENYPLINRWTLVNGSSQWVRIDNTDQTTQNGILFADARWAPNSTTNPITDPIPSITSLLTSNYLDLDAPNSLLYPQGTLLFNTRRSGFNVKSFQVDYFDAANFAVDVYSPTIVYQPNQFVLSNGALYVCIAQTLGNIPPNTLYWATVESNVWVTASGNKSDGSPYMGRQAQRSLIVAALKSGVDTSTEAREEQRVFNLMSCPQYPELFPNMVALNNERNNTAFIITDTPLRLAPEDILVWASSNDGLGLTTADGLSTRDVYSGVFYPSCQTTDTTGSPVVQPPSHMMIRTIIRNDEVAFPWLAPAGTRRGVVDNAAQLGYINAITGEFTTLGVRQGLRDTLYENSINPITFIPGVGITNFGNKTTTTVPSALDRINVARLVAFLRGRLEVIGKQFLFEPNDQITRNEITNAIESLMIDLVAKRGIYDYLVVCDLTNNTPARIDRNELYVDIAIEPVKAVEFIYIPVRIKNTGEIAAGISA